MTAIQNVVLVTGLTEAPHLSAIIGDHAPTVGVQHAPDKGAIEQAMKHLSDELATTRLISIATDVIVPAPILSRLPTTGYNFHAGPPNYPGSHPASFAVFEGAEHFGVTLHELTARVDTGGIVAVERFPVRPETTAADLNGEAYAVVIAMFSKWIQRMLSSTDNLPLSEEIWQGPARTRAEAKSLSAPVPEDSGETRERRRRAFSIIPQD